MPHYLLNAVAQAEQGAELRERVAGLLRVGLWGVGAGEPHRDALAAGDLVLVYLGGPTGEFVGRAELSSSVREWTPAEARLYPGDVATGVALARVEEWDQPVPIDVVLPRLGPAARADFDVGVVSITAHEYETVLALATGHARSTS